MEALGLEEARCKFDRLEAHERVNASQAQTILGGSQGGYRSAPCDLSCLPSHRRGTRSGHRNSSALQLLYLRFRDRRVSAPRRSSTQWRPAAAWHECPLPPPHCPSNLVRAGAKIRSSNEEWRQSPFRTSALALARLLHARNTCAPVGEGPNRIVLPRQNSQFVKRRQTVPVVGASVADR